MPVVRAPSLPVIIIVLILVLPSISTSARIELISVLVPDLSSTLAPPILPSINETLVQICPDDPLIQLRPADILQTIQRVRVVVVLHETEPARRLLESVEAHHDALHLTAFAEQLVYLFFRGVEGEVSDVQRRGILELLVDLRRGAAFVGTVVGAVAVVEPAFLILANVMSPMYLHLG